MRLFRGSFLGVALFGFLGIAGCNLEHNVDVKQKWTMKPNGIAWYNNDTGTNQKRKVKVSLKAFPSGCSVAVAVVLKDDFEASKEAMKKGGEPPKYFASHAGGDNIQFEEFVIDAHTPFTVIAINRSDETVEAELKVKSR
jgi:hypothetical protein